MSASQPKPNPFSREAEGKSTPRQLADEALQHFKRAGSNIGIEALENDSEILDSKILDGQASDVIKISVLIHNSEDAK
jgi:hypothetical protein